MLLRVQNLTVEYKTTRGRIRAVDDVSFEVDEGETLGLAGESGCGKTTAALSLMRLLPRNASILGGRVLLDGTDLITVDERALNRDFRWKQVSIIFQGAMNSLNPVLRVGDQIAEAVVAHDRNKGKREAIEIGKEMLGLVGIRRERANSYPHELSGGQKQRVVIAMALATRPKLVIADEPTTALDVIVQAQILELLRSLRERLGLTMLLISHDLAVMAISCTKVAMMYAGRVTELGRVRQVFKEPTHPYTQVLLKTLPTIRGERKGLRQLVGSPPSLLIPPGGCRFHPRCPFSAERCAVDEPALLEVAPGHTAACHFAGEVKVT